MKKLVTAACALVAASAFAVESANTVGYTTQAIAADTFYMIGVQFENVGGGTITFDNLITMSGVQAYDDGEGKLAQTKQMMDLLQKEYLNGNYVIAGGDFNQVFPGSLAIWPNNHPENWIPGLLETEALPSGFRYVCDLSAPTCRLLNQPYNPEDSVNTQYYSIDGFIVSPNVTVSSVETLDYEFRNSDHNPVYITVNLE